MTQSETLSTWKRVMLYPKVRNPFIRLPSKQLTSTLEPKPWWQTQLTVPAGKRKTVCLTHLAGEKWLSGVFCILVPQLPKVYFQGVLPHSTAHLTAGLRFPALRETPLTPKDGIGNSVLISLGFQICVYVDQLRTCYWRQAVNLFKPLWQNIRLSGLNNRNPSTHNPAG